MGTQTPKQPSIAEETPGGCQGWLLSLKQLAALLGLSVRSLHRLNAAGGLPRPVRLNGAVRFRADEIRDWIAAGCPKRKEWEASGREGKKGGRS